jgi:hypothetical protein
VSRDATDVGRNHVVIVKQLTDAHIAFGRVDNGTRPARIHTLTSKRRDGRGHLWRAIIPPSLYMAVTGVGALAVLYAASDPFRSTP